MSLVAAPALAGADSAAPRTSGAQAAYRDELIARATERGLAGSSQWHALLHYRPDRFGGGVTSFADSEAFFLSPDGKVNPVGELAATIARLFDPQGDDPDAHPQCRFVARYRWLDAELGFDPARLPRRPCPGFGEWFAALDPYGLTLVFPEAYVNNPSSTFGHTLLRIDGAEVGRGLDLTRYSINYAAASTDDMAPVYAVKGMLGGYPGLFAVEPFYEKIKQYGDWEQRDIWEYPLDFTPAEVHRILEHLWELDEVTFDYYYFDENCAQLLLRLLRVARPDDAFDRALPRPWVLPIDAVRVAVDEAVGDREVTYRASSATRLRYAARTESPAVIDAAVALSSGEIEPADPSLAALGPAGEARALALAQEHLRFRVLADEVDREEVVGEMRALLVALSRADRASPPADPPRPRVRPDHGHSAVRFGSGGGVEDGRGFAELRVRPAFHDLVDPWGGFIRGSQVVFMEGALRWTPSTERVRVHDLAVLDVMSLGARGPFLQPMAWRFSTGLRTRWLPADGGSGGPLDPEPVYRTDGGVGLAYEPWYGVRVYGLAEAVLDLGGDLDDRYAAGPGATLGALLGTVEGAWGLDVRGGVTGFVLGDETTQVRAGATARVRLNDRLALRAGAEFVRTYGEERVDALASIHFYP